MDRDSFSLQKKSANKRSRRWTRDEAVVSHWNDLRVVPAKVDGKRTYRYVIISAGQPSDEDSERGDGVRAVRHNNSDSCLQRHKLYTDGAVHSVAEADSTASKDYDSENISGEEHDKCSKLSLNDSNNVDDESMMNLAQSCEQRMVITEKPSTAVLTSGTTVSSTSNNHVPCTHKQSAAAVRRRGERRHRLEATTDFLDTDTVI